MAAYHAVLDVGRHGARAAPRPRRPPHPRPQGQLLRPQLPLRVLRRLAGDRAHRPRRGAAAGAGAPAEADRHRRLGVPAAHRLRRLPGDRRRGRRAVHGRHGPHLRPRRRGPAPEPGGVGRHRHVDDPQDARRAALGLRPVPRRARAEDRLGGVPGPAGRPALPRHGGQGGVLRGRRRPRPSASTSGRCAPTPTRWPRRCSRAATGSSPAAPTRTSCCSTCAAASGRAATPRTACTPIGLTANRNAVPFDERPPAVSSGVRIGTPAATMRGLDADDFREVGAHHLRRAGARRRPAGAAPRASTPCSRAARCTPACAATRPTTASDERPGRARARRLRAPARAAQGHAAARRHHEHARLPPAVGRDRRDADLRGDARPGARARRGADAARDDDGPPGVRARRSASCRSCARAWACSTASSR